MSYSKDYRSGHNDKDYDRYGSKRTNSTGSADSWLKPSHGDDKSGSTDNKYDSGSSHDSRYQNWEQDQQRSASTSARNNHNLNTDSAYKQWENIGSRSRFPNISIGQILMIFLFIIMVVADILSPGKSLRQSPQRAPATTKEAAMVIKYSDHDLHNLLITRPELQAGSETFNQAKAETYLLHSVINNKLISTKFLLTLPININITNTNGEPLIQVAMAQNSDAMVTALLAREPDLSVRRSSGMGVIHTAAANNYENVVNAALNQNISPSLSASGMTPLHYAARNGHMNIVKTLLQRGADPGISNGYGWYPADVCKDKYPEISQLIVKNGGTIRNFSRAY